MLRNHPGPRFTKSHVEFDRNCSNVSEIRYYLNLRLINASRNLLTFENVKCHRNCFETFRGNFFASHCRILIRSQRVAQFHWLISGGVAWRSVFMFSSASHKQHRTTMGKAKTKRENRAERSVRTSQYIDIVVTSRIYTGQIYTGQNYTGHFYTVQFSQDIFLLDEITLDFFTST